MHNQKKDNNNLKTKNKQNRQKIELYGSPTTKEIKKKHSSRPVGRTETGSQGREGNTRTAKQQLVDPGRGQIMERGRQCRS